MNTTPITLQYTTFNDPLPTFIFEGLKQFSAQANRYHSQPDMLRKKIAELQHVTEEMIFLMPGADEGIQMFSMAFGQHITYFTPTYQVYSDMKQYNGNLFPIDCLQNNEYQIPVETIDDATLIFIANPNNPCGYTSKNQILKLVKNNPQAIVVVDEVYAEFMDISVIDDVKNYSNLVVFRSFSKSYGMAGNRVAYVVANPEIISKVKTKTQWANVSYLSIGAASTALDHKKYFLDYIEDIKQRRDIFHQYLVKKGFTLLPSYINAVLIKFSDDENGTAFVNYLKKNMITVSHGNAASNTGLDLSYVRIAIGTPKEMKILTDVIEEYIS